MSEESALDARTIILSILAIAAFVAIGFGVAVLGIPDDPTPVLANAPGTDTTTSTTSEAAPSSTLPEVAAPIEIFFEPVQGLGFERDRVWTFDPETRTLENLVTFRTNLDELLVAHTEFIPPVVLDLGDFEFEPLTDDVVTEEDGTKTFRFEVETTEVAPGEASWVVVTADVLTRDDLEQLAAARDKAEAELFGGG